jgi:hypothetical protein
MKGKSMSVKTEQQGLEYKTMLDELWYDAWNYTTFGNYKPSKNFYKFMKAYRRHITMLEKRIEELENRDTK